MRIKIVSDGTVLGTRVIDRETGDVLQDITSVSWSVSCERGKPLATATLIFSNIPIEAEADVANQ